MTALRTSGLGMPVHVSAALLPLPPAGAKEWTRRFVRHAFAAARAEKGEAMWFPDSLGEVGPAPDDEVHAMVIGGELHVSPAMWERLKKKAEAMTIEAPIQPFPGGRL